jgi:hypothetical protein
VYLDNLIREIIMKFLKELTEWATDIPNHTYLVVDSKDKMLGYIRSDSKKLEMFKQPLPFDVRRRKFKQVPNTFGYVEPKLVNTANSWQVKSSSGSVYTIEKNGTRLSCTCVGFKFKSKCRHVDEFVVPA